MNRAIGSGFGSLCRFALASPLYGLTLAGGAPDEPVFVPRDPWPGVAAQGERLLRAEAEMSAGLRRGGRGRGFEPMWHAWLHGFSWLRDLRALGGDDARRQARDLVGLWMAENARWSELPWRPDVLGARLVAWLGCWDFFAASADDAYRRRLTECIARQSRHLARSVRGGPAGAGRVAAIHGLAAAGAALPGGERRIVQALRLLERELPQQILPDGGHCERSPSLQLEVLSRLVDMRNLLRAVGREPPAALADAIARAAPMLRFFRCGDGGTALFNDSNIEDAGMVDLVLAQADAKGRPPVSAPDMGFERLSANRTSILVDTGAPAVPGLDAHAHAGTLSFEMCIGKERLIVNCGAHLGGGATWRTVQRATAAHSTLSIEDTNSAELLLDGGLGRRPWEVLCERHADAGNIWLEASHDGYSEPFGVIHQRRVYLASTGDDVRGEDTLIGGDGRRFAIRFHLHPRVQASLIQEGAAVLMRLPNGSGWRFRASGGRLGLSDSVFLGERGVVKRTEQIVVEGTAQAGTSVKWALQAIPKK